MSDYLSMKKLAILSVTFIFAALFSISSLAQTSTDETKKESPLLAKWDIIFSALGQEAPGTFKLEKDGDNFKGLVSKGLGDFSLKNIKVKDDNTFTSDVTVNFQGQSFVGTMNGKLDGDKLSGELNLLGLGAIPFAGKKANLAESSVNKGICPNPAKLRNICLSLRTKVKTSDGQEYQYRKKIFDSICKNSEDTVISIAEKIRVLWQNNEDLFVCNEESIIKMAVSLQNNEFIDDVIRWKVNLNRIDESDKMTVLDYIKKKLRIIKEML